MIFRSSLIAASLAVSLAGCTAPPQPAADAQADKASPTAQPVAEKPAEAAPPAQPAGPPTLRELDEAQRAEVLVAAKSCNLESADGQAFSGADLTLSMPNTGKATGWLRADDATLAPESPMLRFESEDRAHVWEVPVQLTVARDDLSPAGGTPGFDAAFDAGALASGRYHVYLAYRAGDKLYACDNGRHVSVL
ncbi:MAG: hypothetical protein ACTHOH_01555 [Lysobacteraceae bacterium]